MWKIVKSSAYDIHCYTQNDKKIKLILNTNEQESAYIDIHEMTVLDKDSVMLTFRALLLALREIA